MSKHESTTLVLGGTSAIALAYCRRLAPRGDRFVLVGRQEARLETIKADLKARGAEEVVVIVSELKDTISCETRFKEFCAPLGFPDQVLLAYGFLGDQKNAENDPVETRRILDVNFISTAVWIQLAAKHLPRDQPRWIIVIGSVAGDRGRRSNYVYGAAKAGLAAFAEGVAHRLHGTPLRVLTVKAGLIDTPMTAHLHRSGPLWARPEQVAERISEAVRRERSTVVYAPWFWQAIMAVVRHLPRPVFYRTRL